jgi:hypothetical protein
MGKFTTYKTFVTLVPENPPEKMLLLSKPANFSQALFISQQEWFNIFLHVVIFKYLCTFELCMWTGLRFLFSKLPNAKMSNAALSKRVKTTHCWKPSCQTSSYKMSKFLIAKHFYRNCTWLTKLRPLVYTLHLRWAVRRGQYYIMRGIFRTVH